MKAALLRISIAALDLLFISICFCMLSMLVCQFMVFASTGAKEWITLHDVFVAFGVRWPGSGWKGLDQIAAHLTGLPCPLLTAPLLFTASTVSNLLVRRASAVAMNDSPKMS